MKFNLKVRLASLALSLGIILLSTFACNTVKADKLVKVTGRLQVINEYILPKTDISQSDAAWFRELPVINPRWSIRDISNSFVLDENLSSSGAKIESDSDSTTLKDNFFTIKLSPQHPIIVVKSKLGDTIQSFNLSQEELKSGTIDLTIKNNLNKKLNEMNKDMDDMLDSNSNTASPFMGLWYYPGQRNGHKYRAGVHVQCNDFNGPANLSHYYWSRRSGKIAAAKALKNFVGSDCDWHQIEYGCEMNRNLKCRGLSKHPKNCSSFSSKWHHTNWSVRLHWRS